MGTAEDAIPQRVINALMEFVDATLDGRRMPIVDLRSEGVSSAAVGGQNMSFASPNESRLPAGSRRELDLIIETYFPEDSVVNREYNGSDEPIYGE
jgi:hypothetical protein